MRRNSQPVVTIALYICLVLALSCVLADRPQPSFRALNFVNSKQRRNNGEMALIPNIVAGGLQHRALSGSATTSLHPTVPEQRWSLKKKNSSSKASKPQKPKKKKKKKLGKRGAAALGSVLTVVFVSVVALIVFLVWVIARKEKDPEWRLRDMFKRNHNKGSGHQEMQGKIFKEADLEDPKQQLQGDDSKATVSSK